MARSPNHSKSKANSLRRIKQKIALTKIETTYFIVVYALTGKPLPFESNSYLYFLWTGLILTHCAFFKPEDYSVVGEYISKITSFFADTVWFIFRSYEAAFWIIVVIHILAAMLFFYVCLTAYYKKPFNSLHIKILRGFLSIFTVYLYIPSINSVGTYIFCSKNSNGIYISRVEGKIQCYNTSTAAHSIFGIITLFIIAFFIFTHSYLLLLHHNSRVINGRQLFYIKIYNIFLYVTCTWNALLISSNITTVVRLCFILYSVYRIWFYMPYYEIKNNRKMLISQYIPSAGIIFDCLRVWGVPELATTIIFIVSIIPGVIGINYLFKFYKKRIFNSEKFQNVLLSSGSKKNETENLLSHANSDFAIKTTKGISNPSETFPGYIKQTHSPYDLFFAISIAAEMVQKPDNEFYHTAYMVFKGNIGKYSTESSFWAYFLNYSIIYNQELETIVMKIPDISPYDLKYLLYHSLLLLEEKQSINETNELYETNNKNKNNNPTKNIDNYKEVEYKRAFNQSQKQHEKLITLLFTFWRNMSMTKTLPNHIIAVRMQNIFGQIRDVDAKVNNSYHTLMTKFPGHAEVLRGYGNYMQYVRDDLVKADELYDWADEIENPDIFMNNRENRLSDDDDEVMDSAREDEDSFVNNNASVTNLSVGSDNSITKDLKMKNSLDRVRENLLANKKTQMKKTIAMKDDKNKVSFDNGMGLQYLEKFTLYYYIIEAIIFTVISGIVCILLIVYFWYFVKYYHSILLTPYFLYQNLIDVYQITISSDPGHVNYWLNLMSDDLVHLKSIYYPLLRCPSDNIIISGTCRLAHLGDRKKLSITKWLINGREYMEEVYLTDARSRLINSVHTILTEYNKQDTSIISKALVKEEENNVLYNTVEIPDSYFPVLKESYDNVVHRLDVILYVIIIYVVMKSVFLIVSVFLFRNKIRLGHLEQHIGFDIIKMIPDYECERLTESFEYLLNKRNNVASSSYCEEMEKEKYKSRTEEVWTLENNPSNPLVVEEKIKFFTQESYKCKTLKKKTHNIYWILFVEFILGIALLLLFIFMLQDEKQLVGALLYKGYRMMSINKIEYVIQETIKHSDDITKYNKYHKMLESELNNLMYYQSCSSWHCDNGDIEYQDLYDLPSDIFKQSYFSYFTDNYYQRSLDSTINEYYRISFSIYNEERTKLSFNHPTYLMFKDLITNRNLHKQLLEIISLTDDIMFSSLETLIIIVSAYFVVLFIIQTTIYYFFLSSVPKNFIGDIIMIRFLLNHVSSTIVTQYPIITRYTEATAWTNARINNYNDDDSD